MFSICHPDAFGVAFFLAISVVEEPPIKIAVVNSWNKNYFQGKNTESLKASGFVCVDSNRK